MSRDKAGVIILLLLIVLTGSILLACDNSVSIPNTTPQEQEEPEDTVLKIEVPNFYSSWQSADRVVFKVSGSDGSILIEKTVDHNSNGTEIIEDDGGFFLKIITDKSGDNYSAIVNIYNDDVSDTEATVSGASESFSINRGKTTSVTVNCKPNSTIVKEITDEDINSSTPQTFIQKSAKRDEQTSEIISGGETWLSFTSPSNGAISFNMDLPEVSTKSVTAFRNFTEESSVEGRLYLVPENEKDNSLSKNRVKGRVDDGSVYFSNLESNSKYYASFVLLGDGTEQSFDLSISEANTISGKITLSENIDNEILSKTEGMVFLVPEFKQNMAAIDFTAYTFLESPKQNGDAIEWSYVLAYSGNEESVLSAGFIKNEKDWPAVGDYLGAYDVNPETPMKFLELSGIEPYTFSGNKTNIDISLYETNLERYIITFNGNGNTSGTNLSVEKDYGTSISYPTAQEMSIEKTGYTLKAWNTEPDYTGESFEPGSSLTVTEAKTYYAEWQIATYSISYNANGGSNPPSTTTAEYGTTVTIAPTDSMTKTGHTFIAWNTKADGSGQSYAPGTSFTIPAQDLTLYAQWEINKYTTTFNGNGNTSGTNLSVENDYGTSISYPTAQEMSIEKTGHTLKAWNTEPDSTGESFEPGSSLTVTEAKNYYAEWQVVSYTISYNANDGSNPPSTTTAEYGTTVTIASADSMTKTGHTFIAWNTKADGSGQSYAPGASFTIPAQNTTLYAQWEINKYTISFNGNGNTSGSDLSVEKDYGTSISLPTAQEMSIEKTGHILKAWNTEARLFWRKL